MPSKGVRLPLKISHTGQPIVLEVLLKGRRGSRFIKMVLDTGATMSTIPAEAALAIGCDPAEPLKRIEMITASGMEFVPVVRIPKIKFLGFELRGIEAAVLSLPPKSLVSGLLGINALREFDILLGFRSQFLSFTR